MEVDRRENGALVIRAHKGIPFYEAKWRDATGRQRKRRLGRAWLELDAGGDWTKRRGRIRDGFLDERRAYREMGLAIEEVEAQQQIAPRLREARFEDAAELWMQHLEFEKRAKPSTLDRHRTMLAKPRPGRVKQRGARIMREFGGCKLALITTEDIRRFLARLDREDVSARTVNIHRQVLHSIFEHARRKDTFGLRYNPVADTTKRPEEGARPVETFEPRELRLIAEAARRGFTEAAAATSIRPSPRRPTPSGPGSTSRMAPSSSSPGAPAFASVSCWRSTGATSTSSAASSRCRGRCQRARSRAPSRGDRVRSRWPIRLHSS